MESSEPSTSMWMILAYGKFAAVAGDPVVEPDTQGDNQVCIVHSHGGSVVAVHTLHSQKTGMVCGDSGKSHQRAADGSVDGFRQGEHFLLGMGCNEAAAKVNVGPFGCVDLFCCLLDADLLCRMG